MTYDILYNCWLNILWAFLNEELETEIKNKYFQYSVILADRKFSYEAKFVHVYGFMITNEFDSSLVIGIYFHASVTSYNWKILH